MERCFGMQGSEAREASREHLAQNFYGFTIFRRILRGREHPEEWKIEEVNSQKVIQLRESGQSFIMAPGHFRRESLLPLFMRRISPGGLATVSIPLPARSLSPDTIRLRVQFGQFQDAVSHIRPDGEFVYAGNRGSGLLQLLNHLERPGRQVIIFADALWERTPLLTHTRPFAGMRARDFSIGTAALGRMTQCPVVGCATYVRSDGTVVVEWGPVISPPPLDEEEADVPNMDRLLDFLECAIGRRPCQYVFWIGHERKWNTRAQRWEDPGAGK